jgi:hypothetical protein
MTETSATILNRMADDALKLVDVWEAEGNRNLNDFNHGNAIPMSIDEWALGLMGLAMELERPARLERLGRK